MTEWSKWLSDELDRRGWRQADFVRESHGTVQRDRVSKWLSGDSKPSHRYAIIVANILGIDHQEVLKAAGYETSAVEEYFAAVVAGAPNMGLQAYTELELIDELRRRARERESAATNAVD